MAATIQTTNRVLAATVASDPRNRGATNRWTGSVWEVSHADQLIITMTSAVRAGYSPSYDDDWEGFSDMITDGYVDHHTQRELCVKSGTTADRDYLASTGPTRAESMQDPPQDWRDRLLTYGVI